MNGGAEHRTGRPRLAYWSPLPPLASGIADYSAELLPHLAEHFEIEVFTEDGYRPDEELARRYAVRGAREFAGRRAERPDDAVLYQLGNNADFHAGAYRALLATPGIVVLHELVLHHMIRELTLVAGDQAAYLEEVRYCCGARGGAIARRSLETGAAVDTWSYPLFERVVDRSLGVLVHSQGSRRRILASRPLAEVRTVPFPWSPEPVAPAGSASDLRDRLGLPADALLLASFGFMTRPKRLDVALRAFVRLAREVPRARFLVVGEVSKDYDLDALVPADLRSRVTVTGRVGMADFLAAMAAADIALNLRYPTAGETSASLYRLFGLGRAVVVSDAGSFAELPAGCCARVPPDEAEEDLLLAYLRALAADPALRQAMGESARRLVAERHRVEQTASAYAEAIHAILATARPPARVVPPLGPYPPEDMLSEVVSGVTAAAVDLGLGEDDDDLLREVSAAIVDLDLDASLGIGRGVSPNVRSRMGTGDRGVRA